MQAEARGKPSSEKAPSLKNHRLWCVAVRLAPPDAQVKLQFLLDAVKNLLDQTSGMTVEARWLAALVSVPVVAPGPPAGGGGASLSSSASGSSAHIRPIVGTHGLPCDVNVMIYLLCGTAGKRKSTVKRSIELLVEKMAEKAATRTNRGGTLTRAAGVLEVRLT